MIDVEIDPGIVPRVIVGGAVEGERVIGRNLTDDSTWIAAQAAPVGRFLDPAAPLNIPFRYESPSGESQVVLRESQVYGAFTSLNGREIIPFIMPHEWEDTDAPDVAEYQVAGRVWTLNGPHTRVGKHRIRARIAGESIPAMRALLKGQQQVVFLHAPCPVPHCPVPPALPGVVTAAPGAVTARKDLGEMIYEVDFLPKPIRRPVPAFTWADVKASHATWADVAAVGSWADVRDGR